MKTMDVVGLGAMNIDRMYCVESIITDGEVLVEGARQFPGGSAANTIYGLARLGMRTGFAGAVGDDEEGRMLLQDFQAAGVDASQIRQKQGAHTGLVLCLSDIEGKRALYVTPGANSLLSSDDIDLTYLNRASILHLSSFVDERQFNIQVELASRLDPTTRLSFAPGSIYASKGLAALAPLLGKTCVLFTNRDELRRLTGEDFSTGARICCEQGCHIVVVTMGKGISSDPEEKEQTIACHIYDGNEEYQIKSKAGETKSPLETTGAGDAFAAGFLFGLLRGESLPRCGLLGDLVARFCITQMGARVGLPSLAQLSQQYEECFQQSL